MRDIEWRTEILAEYLNLVSQYPAERGSADVCVVDPEGRRAARLSDGSVAEQGSI